MAGDVQVDGRGSLPQWHAYHLHALEGENVTARRSDAPIEKDTRDGKHVGLHARFEPVGRAGDILVCEVG